MSYETSSFDDDVYLLSSARHIRDNIPASTPKGDSERKKHLLLLDDIALLLITKAKGDVCAVTWRTTNQRIEFFYSKNAPCHRSLEPYLSEIKQIVATPMSSRAREEKLLTLILKTCLEKVGSRVQKLQKALSTYPQPLKFPSDSKDLSKLREKWEDMNDGQIVVEYLTNLRDTDLKMEKLKADISTLVILSRAAFLIGSVAHLFYELNGLTNSILGSLEFMKPYQPLTRRVRKLGSYYCAVVRISTYLDMPQYAEFGKKVHFTEVGDQ